LNRFCFLPSVLYQTDVVLGGGSRDTEGGSDDDNTPIKGRGYDVNEADWGDIEKNIW
jgi:hypothetical protein